VGAGAADGGITVSYRNTTFPGINPEAIKLSIAHQRRAQAPTCSAPVLITRERPRFSHPSSETCPWAMSCTQACPPSGERRQERYHISGL